MPPLSCSRNRMNGGSQLLAVRVVIMQADDQRNTAAKSGRYPHKRTGTKTGDARNR